MTLRIRAAALASTLILMLPASLAAQQSPGGDAPDQRKGGTYVKLGLAHWQRNIFGGQSLTRWEGNLFGSDFDLTSAALEIETYFDRTHLQLSGWSVGYRKDVLRLRDSGHMVHAGLFRSFDLTVFEVRTSGGVEWGVPSLNFDTTVFDDRDDGTVRYNHVFPVKNANVPFVGTREDGAVYPFVELSVVQRPGRFLIEGGMRMNIVGFRFDDFEVDPMDEITYAFIEKRVVMPYLFVNLGFRMF